MVHSHPLGAIPLVLAAALPVLATMMAMAMVTAEVAVMRAMVGVH
jgi:hypothetical protein|tara:strand:- start:1424 stop:1558 length:135 start_codon:yes stop_codon:yes gene_type:complete